MKMAECLMLNRVLVPQYKLFGEDALLRCDYDLGRDRLYAVKWYKDNEEFFRFVPRFNPPIYTHPMDGSRLKCFAPTTSASCSAPSPSNQQAFSAEAPSFASIMGEGRMTVVYLPKEAPQITGNVREEYEVGDVLDLNCTSSKSFPPAKISWYINDNPVEMPWSVSLRPAPSETGPNQEVPSPGSNSLMVSSLRLQLTLTPHHFGRKGTARVRCVARISPLFWQDGDEKIFGHGSGSSGHSHRHEKSSSGGSKQKTEKFHNFSDEEGEDFHSKSIHAINPVEHQHHHVNPHEFHSQNQAAFGHGLSFQREALVLVRSGCSSQSSSIYVVLLVFFCLLR
ncbi:Cell adhesion molecule 2 [Orchesella cincta]|uniref:Cell adhesion molecule 2 n=1 Tax=Orchesella cincta TaxID=48709 RepID=A0A1D2ML56_ORCCI|nr:Cell adhesion molecule 2 [Orchesella cincta]